MVGASLVEAEVQEMCVWQVVALGFLKAHVEALEESGEGVFSWASWTIGPSPKSIWASSPEALSQRETGCG